MSRLTAVARGLLVAVLLLLALAGVQAVEYLLLQDMVNGNYDDLAALRRRADASDQRVGVVSVVMVGTWAISIVVNMAWIHRACTNARALSAAQMRFTPGWAVGWYFVPIANLWKPFQAMKEIWAASRDPLGWETGPAPGLLRLWWALWLISSFCGNVSFKLTARANTIEAMIDSDLFDIVTLPFDLALVVVFLTVMRRIHAMQRLARLRAEMAAA